jgi:hypothetical protein
MLFFERDGLTVLIAKLAKIEMKEREQDRFFQ